MKNNKIGKNMINKHINMKTDKKWVNTKWEDFMKIIPTLRGTAMQYIFHDCLKSNNIDCENNLDNTKGYDYLFKKSNKKVEFKYGSEGKDGSITLNQIRVPDERYDYLIIALVYPNKDEYYIIKKQCINNFAISEQHPGSITHTLVIRTTEDSENRKELNTGKYGDGTLDSCLNIIRSL